MNANIHVNMGKISYINASPVYYGLDHGLLPSWLNMVADVPSALNRQLMAGQVVLSPISAAFYAAHTKDLILLPDLSISCHGRVLSVLLASQYPIEELDRKTVMFSRETASAASFMKMIFNRKGIEPAYEVGSVDDCRSLSETMDAVLVIGDNALTQPWDQVYRYCFDLGALWFEMTQLPFVFAVWAVRRDFAKKFPLEVKEIHQLLLSSRQEGDANLGQVIETAREKTGLDEDLLKKYYDRLYCDLDDQKISAMKLFFNSLVEQQVLTEKPAVEFFSG